MIPAFCYAGTTDKGIGVRDNRVNSILNSNRDASAPDLIPLRHLCPYIHASAHNMELLTHLDGSRKIFRLSVSKSKIFANTAPTYLLPCLFPLSFADDC